MAFSRRRGDDVGDLSRADLAGLLAAARAVNEAGGLAATLEAILTTALRLLAADEGSVMLLDQARTGLRIHAARGLPADVAATVVVPVGEGISGYVASSGTPLLLSSDADLQRFTRGTDPNRKLQSAMSVPLRTQGVIEGVLNINLTTNARGPFGDADLTLVGLFAEFAASAVHNAQLYSQARRRGDEMARLFEASHSLSRAVTVEEVSDSILDAASDLMGDITGGFVCSLPEDKPGPEISRFRSLQRGRIITLMRREEFPELLRANRLRVVGDASNDPVLNALVQDDAGRTGVIVAPLVAGGATRGLLVSTFTGQGPDDASLRLLTTYTNHAALALTKALLLRSVQDKEDELTSLSTSVPDPIIICDRAGRLLSVNPAAAEQFGLNPQFDIGQPLRGKLRNADLEALLDSGEVGRADVTLFTPEPRTYRARVTPVRPGHGIAGARILMLEDITTERELEQIKADFVAVLGHELRTPLTLVKGYASTLAKRHADMEVEARGKALEHISSHAYRLERLIEDLLLVSRVERGRPPLHVERRDLGPVVHSAVELASTQHEGRIIRASVPPLQLQMLVDVTKVEQVLHHLIDNAVKFSEAPEPVDVELEARSDEVEIRVVDRGLGIFSGDIPRLFERFHQVDGSQTRAHGGTGIGLYICKTLVEAHGGRISVKSALGRGSTFRVILPATPPPPESDPDQPSFVKR